MLHPDGIGCAPVHSRVRRDEHSATLIARARIRLEPGDNLTFSVRCDVVGDPALGTCFDAVNIGGRSIEIDEI